MEVIKKKKPRICLQKEVKQIECKKKKLKKTLKIF